VITDTNFSFKIGNKSCVACLKVRFNANAFCMLRVPDNQLDVSYLKTRRVTSIGLRMQPTKLLLLTSTGQEAFGYPQSVKYVLMNFNFTEF